MFYKKRCFWKLHRKTPLFLNKFAGLIHTTLLKKDLWHRPFPVNFGKFLRTPLSQNTSGRLLLARSQTAVKNIIWRVKCALSYSYCNWYGQLSFSIKKKRPWYYIKLKMSMIFISGIISIITHKNMLCTNKIRSIYFCPNCVNVLPENVYFWGERLPPASTSMCDYGNRTFCN